MNSPRHRWGIKVRFAHKTEQQCARCDIVKVARQEWEAGRPVYWTEYWRDEERIDQDCRTPSCDARNEQARAGGDASRQPPCKGDNDDQTQTERYSHIAALDGSRGRARREHLEC
jgi:hypothetical protein